MLENWRPVWKKIHIFGVRSCVIKDTIAGNKGHEARRRRTGPRGQDKLFRGCSQKGPQTGAIHPQDQVMRGKQAELQAGKEHSKETVSAKAPRQHACHS